MRGHAVTMSLVILSCIIYGSMYFYFKSENRKRERGERDGIISGLTEEEIIELGKILIIRAVTLKSQTNADPV